MVSRNKFGDESSIFEKRLTLSFRRTFLFPGGPDNFFFEVLWRAGLLIDRIALAAGEGSASGNSGKETSPGAAIAAKEHADLVALITLGAPICSRSVIFGIAIAVFLTTASWPNG